MSSAQTEAYRPHERAALRQMQAEARVGPLGQKCMALQQAHHVQIQEFQLQIPQSDASERFRARILAVRHTSRRSAHT